MFINRLLGLLLNYQQNDTPLVDPVEIQSSSESEVDEEDDDETILRGET